jgi:hypothetical protein
VPPLTAEEIRQRDELLARGAQLTAEMDEFEAAHPPDEPIAASAVGVPAGARSAGPTPGRMAAVRGRARPSPDAQPSANGVTVTAELGARGIAPGAALTSSAELGELMVEALDQLTPDGTSQRRSRRCARATWDLPPERQLGSHDGAGNMRKIDAVCAPAAVLASGGVCLPVDVDFSVPVWSTADRPLRDALPAFQADRGGVRYVSPPDIGVPSLQATASGAGTATSVWSEATDASPAGATKPVWVVACGTEELVYVSATPTRVQFGNMQGRFAPEQVAANTEQAMAVAAREAELELLTTMYGSSKQVKPEQYLGATRDLLASVDLLIAQYRYSHRIPKGANFTAVFPDWARDVIRADMVREIGHDNAGPQNVLAVSDDQIDGWFKDRGINPIWTLDGLKAGTYGTGGSAVTNQFFPLLGTNAPEPQWPGESSDGSFQLSWLLYVEGSFQFLDGGRLDLGVVRDSVLDSSNDFEIFVEPFENVAFRGLECYQVQSTILPNGGSAGTVAVGSYHE